MIRAQVVCRQALFLSLAAGCSLLACSPQTYAASPVATPSAHRNLPDSFLPLSAESVEALVQQVQSQPVVRRRYAHYFHIPESRIAAYLQANLVQSSLGQGGVYTVYLVRPNGLIYPTMLTIPKGSAVFALKGGPPVMTGHDGNPLVRYRMAVETHYLPAKTRTVTVRVAPSIQTLVPARAETIVVPTLVPTPVYQQAPLDTGDQATASKP